MQLIASGFRLAEGPTVLDDGGLLISDALGGGVRTLLPDGGEGPALAEGRKGIGGIALDRAGRAIVTGRDVRRLTDGEDEVLLARPDGVTGFNDLAATPEGGLLVGALHFSPFAGESPVPGTLRYVGPDGASRVWHTGIVWPNGMGFSPDGATVYVCDFANGTVSAGAWDPETPGELAVLVTSPSGHTDGLAVAADGSLLVALGGGGGLGRFAPDGELVDTIDVPAGFVSSVCFAGPALDELVVTTMDNTVDPAAGGAVFRAPAPVPGAPVPRYLG